MRLEDRLTYCKICVNQKFSIDEGILCSLTDKKPVFFPTCHDYKEDISKRERAEKEIFYRYRNYLKQSVIEGSRLEYKYPANSKRISKLDETLPETLYLRIPSIGLFLLFLIILISIPIIVVNSNNISTSATSLIIVALTLVLFLSAFYFIKRWRTGFVYAVINDEGIEISKSKLIKWEKVLCVMLKTEQNPEDKIPFAKHYLSFWKLGSSKEDSIELDYFPLYLTWILSVVEVYRMRHKKRALNGDDAMF